MFKRVFGLFTSSTRDLSDTNNDNDDEKKGKQERKQKQIQRNSRIRPKTDSHIYHAKLKLKAKAEAEARTQSKPRSTNNNSSSNNALISLIRLPQGLKLAYRLSLIGVMNPQQTLNDTVIDDSNDNDDISNSSLRNFPSSPTKQAMAQHKAQTHDHDNNLHQYQQVDLQPIDPLPLQQQQQQQQLNDRFVVPSSSSPLPLTIINKKRPQDQLHNSNTRKFNGGNIPKRRKLTRATLATTTTGNIRINSGNTNGIDNQLISSKSSTNLPLKHKTTTTTTTNKFKQIKGVNQLHQNNYKLNLSKSIPGFNHSLSKDIDHYGHSRLKNLKKPSIPSMATSLIPSSSSSGSGLTTHSVSKIQEMEEINNNQVPSNDLDTNINDVYDNMDNNNDYDYDYDHDPIDSVEPEIYSSSSSSEEEEEDENGKDIKEKMLDKVVADSESGNNDTTVVIQTNDDLETKKHQQQQKIVEDEIPREREILMIHSPGEKQKLKRLQRKQERQLQLQNQKSVSPQNETVDNQPLEEPSEQNQLNANRSQEEQVVENQPTRPLKSRTSKKPQKQYFQSWKEEAALLKQKLANDPTFHFSSDKTQQIDEDNDIIIEKITQLRGCQILSSNQSIKKEFDHMDYRKSKHKIPPTSKYYTMDDFFKVRSDNNSSRIKQRQRQRQRQIDNSTLNSRNNEKSTPDPQVQPKPESQPEKSPTETVANSTKRNRSNASFVRKHDILDDLVQDSSEEENHLTDSTRWARKRKLSLSSSSSTLSSHIDSVEDLQCEVIDITGSPDYSTVVRAALDIKTLITEKDVSTEDGETTATSPTKHFENNSNIESEVSLPENPVPQKEISSIPKLTYTRSGQSKNKSHDTGKLLQPQSNDLSKLSPRRKAGGSTSQKVSHQLERLDSQESQGNLSQEKHRDVELSPSKLPPDEQQEDSDYEFDNVDWPGDDIVPENMVTYSQEQQKKLPPPNTNTDDNEAFIDNEINKSNNAISNPRLAERENTNEMTDNLEELHHSVTSKKSHETNTDDANTSIYNHLPDSPSSKWHDQIDSTQSKSSHYIIEAEEQENTLANDKVIEPFTQETELLMSRLPSELQTPISRNILLTLTKQDNPNNDNSNGDSEVYTETHVADTENNQPVVSVVLPSSKQNEATISSPKTSIRTPQIFTRNNKKVSKDRIKVSKNVMRLLNSSEEEEEEEEENVQVMVENENENLENNKSDDQNNDKTPPMESTIDPENHQNESNKPELTQEQPQTQEQQTTTHKPNIVSNESVQPSSPTQSPSETQVLERANQRNVDVSWEDDIEDSDSDFFKEMDAKYDLVAYSKSRKSKSNEIVFEKQSNDKVINSVQTETFNRVSPQVTNHEPHNVVNDQSKAGNETQLHETTEGKEEKNTGEYHHTDSMMKLNPRDMDVLMSDIESDISITNIKNQDSPPIQESNPNEYASPGNDSELCSEPDNDDSEDDLYNRLKYAGVQSSLACTTKLRDKGKVSQQLETKDIDEPKSLIHTIKLSPQDLLGIIDPFPKTFMHTIKLSHGFFRHKIKLPTHLLNSLNNSTETAKDITTTQLPEDLELNLDSMKFNENEKEKENEPIKEPTKEPAKEPTKEHTKEPARKPITSTIRSLMDVYASIPDLEQIPPPPPPPPPINPVIVNEPQRKSFGIKALLEKFPPPEKVTIPVSENVENIKSKPNQLDRIISPDTVEKSSKSSSIEQVRNQFDEKLLLNNNNNVTDGNNVETSKSESKLPIESLNNPKSESKGNDLRKDDDLSKPQPQRVFIDLSLDDDSSSSQSSDKNEGDGDVDEDVNNENNTNIGEDGMDGVVREDNINSTTTNSEPESNDKPEQRINLSLDISTRGDTLAPGALATAYEQLLKNDTLRNILASNGTSLSDKNESSNTVNQDLNPSKEITHQENDSSMVIDSNEDILQQIKNKYRAKYEKFTNFNKNEESRSKEKFGNSIALIGNNKESRSRHSNPSGNGPDTSNRSVNPSTTTASDKSDKSNGVKGKIRQSILHDWKALSLDSDINNSRGDKSTNSQANGERNQSIVTLKEIEDNIISSTNGETNLKKLEINHNNNNNAKDKDSNIDDILQKIDND